MSKYPHPMDFDVLQKGDVISQARIERIYGIREHDDPDRYRQYMLQLGEQIERECADRGFLYRCDGKTIRVMTDEEAESRTWWRIRHGARTMAKNTKRRASIDRSNFDRTELAIAEHRDRVATAVMLKGNSDLRQLNEKFD